MTLEPPEPGVDAPKRKRRSKLRWVLHLALLALVALAVLLLVRAARFETRQLVVEPTPTPDLDWAVAAERLGGAVRIQTISRSAQGNSFSALRREDSAAFKAFHAYLSRSFPEAHRVMQREVIAEHSLLYEWKGSDASLEPVVIGAHMDVAPITPGTSMSWTEKPFSGVLKKDVIWGRGTLDDKAFVIGLLEAIEAAAKAGYAPKRSLFIALSHDQLRGGDVGTRALGAALGSRAKHFRAVLTEGMVVVTGFVKEIPAPIALVGVGEKGQASFLLQGETGSGKDKLEAAQKRLEAAPMQAEFDGAAQYQFEYLAHEFPFAIRVAVANRWLFSSLLESRISESEGSEALIRTLVTSTKVPPGYDESKLPPDPTVVTYRLRPGDTLEQVRAHALATIADADVKLTALDGAYVAPRVSPVTAPEFTTLQRVVEGVFPEAVFAPSLVLGSTDARHYSQLSPNVFRFRPLVLGPADMSRSRNSDERISLADYQRVVSFCAEFLRAFLD